VSLRVVLYDDTCRTSRVGGFVAPIGLTHTWIAGSLLYRGRARADLTRGTTSWSEGLRAVVDAPGPETISELQYWGHGKWGRALVRDDVWDRRALDARHALAPLLDALAARLAPNARVWFRTCETFGGDEGHAFARELSEFLGATVAGHTFIIGPWQSGLHTLAPGAQPTWSTTEGILEGSPARPVRALWSRPDRPNTITCLHDTIPDGY